MYELLYNSSIIEEFHLNLSKKKMFHLVNKVSNIFLLLPLVTWARPAYLEDISPNNSNDQVLIIGAHASAFEETKLHKTVCISVTTLSSLSGIGNKSPVAISV